MQIKITLVSTAKGTLVLKVYVFPAPGRDVHVINDHCSHHMMYLYGYLDHECLTLLYSGEPIIHLLSSTVECLRKFDKFKL